ncbi:MAG: N-acetyl-gamma-glutamyl-phosphate reductase [Sediminibacterium sp.]|nr:N-acetyl-gamma-glutamyl-phosphate reductase [Sediminibacterium sp.]
MNKITVGIIGAAGYTAGELIRILLQHPKVDLVFTHSESQADKFIYEIHSDLLGETDMRFSNKLTEVNLLFLCLAHGEAKQFLLNNKISEQTKIIDLSEDFRAVENAHFNHYSFVYGLSELNHKQIQQTNAIANPGCFATCIELALLPLATHQLLHSDVHINATTGSTGAGQALTNTNQFSWRNNNFSLYKPFQHQHLKEIQQTIKTIQNNFDANFYFIPNRGNFSRGIFSAIYTDIDLEINECMALYKETYRSSPFVFISNENIHLKQVVNTNKCFIYLEKFQSKLLIVSAIDNLLKGASGQAIQNMNIMFDWDETTALKLKSNIF